MVLAIDVVVVGLENGDWVRRLKTGAILDASQTKQNLNRILETSITNISANTIKYAHYYVYEFTPMPMRRRNFATKGSICRVSKNRPQAARMCAT